jgi:hypothetical protein
MWIIAALLLGLVVIAALLGFHSGPHLHLAAGVLGGIAAAWLILMTVRGGPLPVLGVLLGADLLVAGGVGVLAVKGFKGGKPLRGAAHPLEAAEGVAVSDLDPEGIVRVHGENWSATAMNGTVRAGAAVQVLRARSVRLEVWGEEVDPAGDNGTQASPERRIG